MPDGQMPRPSEGRVFRRMNDMTVKVKVSETNGTQKICEETCLPGYSPRRHMYTNYENFYMVAETAIQEVGDQAVKGTTILIPPGVLHKIRSEEDCKML